MSYVAVGVAAYEVYQGAENSSIMQLQADNARKMSEINAKYAEIDAWNAETFGETEAAQYQSKIDQTIGAQRVALAAHNVDVTFGTAGQVQAQTKLTGYLNQLDLVQAGQRKSANLMTEASNIRAQAGMKYQSDSFNADKAMNEGIAGGIKTAYGGYASRQKYAPKNNSGGSSGANALSEDDFSLE